MLSNVILSVKPTSYFKHLWDSYLQTLFKAALTALTTVLPLCILMVLGSIWCDFIEES